jgi:prolyl-tRNA synthetase
MGCYGIGTTRLMGCAVEVLSDEKGIVWPASIATYQVHMIGITNGNKDIEAEANRMYEMLQENDIEVLFDDRDARAGEKFADSDLIGIPTRIVVSEKTVAAGGVELIDRKTGKSKLVSESEIVDVLKK